MSKEFETKPIRIQGGSHLRSVGEQNGIHCLADKSSNGEPVSLLTSRERHDYFTLLTTVGVPEEDALEAARKMKSYVSVASESDVQAHQKPEEVKVKREAARTVKTVLNDFRGLVGMRRTKEPQPVNQKTSLGEPIPVGQEVPVYRRSR